LIETAPMSTVGNFDYYVISARINRFGAVSLDDNGTVLRFVSFDDEVTATQGAASGQTSDQVGTNGTDDTASLSSTDGVTFVPDPNPSPGAPCFAAGTRIMTDQGERAVESLQPGDLVLSHDGALVPLRMALSRRLHRTDLFKYPKLRPVRMWPAQWVKACHGAICLYRVNTGCWCSPESRNACSELMRC
ncbi:MAG: Hint domain-containing protein, partial [Pseudomonadota bacterium]